MIVSGLAPSSTTTDAVLFTNLCTTELNVRPEVVSTKRLGRLQTDRGQPLLVHLKSVDQTKDIINSARLLRHSPDPTIRERVYINPNLTKAEAAAAYQMRLQRRQAQQRRRDGGDQALPPDDNNGSAMNNRTSMLNPQAGPFVPPAAASQPLTN